MKSKVTERVERLEKGVKKLENKAIKDRESKQKLKDVIIDSLESLD